MKNTIENAVNYYEACNAVGFAKIMVDYADKCITDIETNKIINSNNLEKNITIPLWQLKDVENTLRMASNSLESYKKTTCLDRCICKSWEFVKIALKNE